MMRNARFANGKAVRDLAGSHLLLPPHPDRPYEPPPHPALSPKGEREHRRQVHGDSSRKKFWRSSLSMKPDELLHRNAEFAVVGFVAADAFAAGDFEVCRPGVNL